MKKVGGVHLVAPADREVSRIGGVLDILGRSFPDLEPVTVQVVKVSRPGVDREAALSVFSEATSEFPSFLPPLVLPENCGKGGAIRAGWAAAPDGTERLAFVDVDGSIPAREIARLILHARSDEGMVTAFFASQIMMLGREIERNSHRHLVVRDFATISSLTLGIRCYDSQCGFNVMSLEVHRKIEDRMEIDGFSFDLGLLAFLTDAGVPIGEFPIDRYDIAGSSVNLLSNPIRMLFELRDINCRRPARLAS